MRISNWFLPTLAALAVVIVAACGGSSSNEVKTARTAHYKGDKLEIFRAVRAAVESKYKLDKSDENTLILETVGRWFTPEGQHASERLEDIRDVPDKSIHIAYIVKVVPDGDAYLVDIAPKWYRFMAGSPKPESLKEDDISVPGFAHEQADTLAVDIHNALKQWEVKSVPAMVPAGSAAPAPAAPAGEGSGAPAPAPAQ
jgi:hypothetical protein